MSDVNDIPEAERLDLDKRGTERLVDASARARRVLAECNRVFAKRLQNQDGDNGETTIVSALLRA